MYKRQINESIKSAESKKREALVEAKEEILKARNEYEKEVKERRSDLQKQERRLQQKEETLDRKTDNIEKKEETLARRLSELEEAREEVATVKKTQMEVLERISGFTAEEMCIRDRCGFGGAGAFSDGKFNFTTAFGGWLTDFMPAKEVMDLIGYVDSILFLVHS